jgi:hypothetical protein
MIQFIEPVFNAFTLAFPPLTEAETARESNHVLRDFKHTIAAGVFVLAQAEARKARRNRLRLEALCAGGWIIEFEPRQHLGLQTSTRAELRRTKFGRK